MFFLYLLKHRLDDKSQLIKDLESIKARNMATRRFQEGLIKENEEYKSQATNFKTERDEAQQKYILNFHENIDP